MNLFESAAKLFAHAGIDPTVYQTGRFQGSQAGMSKQGSPYLSHDLRQAARMAVKFDPDLHAFYQAWPRAGITVLRSKPSAGSSLYTSTS